MPQNIETSDSQNANKKVIVGMSGGVDSSVAAYLLIQQGYQVEGLFMKNWEEDDNDEYCAAAEDLADAQAVANKLGIELHTINFAAEYWDNVFEYFLDEYRAGRTPNPDIMCNKEIKFKAFLEFAAEDLGADYIATGHYVQRELRNGHWKMLREIALEQDLVTHDKKDSTGICFIGERKFKDFLSQYLPAQPGKIETTEGQDIGNHDGLMYHTLGQRKGLHIGGLKEFGEDPWYVVDKDLDRNVLIVGQGADHPALYSKGLVANQLHWVDREGPQSTLRCCVKTRYRQQDIPCTLTINANSSVDVIFDDPQKAVTPGQSAVFYLNDECLGGGIIEHYLR